MSNLLTRRPVLCGPTAVLAEITAGLKSFMDLTDREVSEWFLTVSRDNADSVIEFRVLSWEGDASPELQEVLDGERELCPEELADCEIFGTAIELNGSHDEALARTVEALRAYSAWELRQKSSERSVGMSSRVAMFFARLIGRRPKTLK